MSVSNNTNLTNTSSNINVSISELSNLVENLVSNKMDVNITTNIINPMDFISMQNHMIGFWLGAIGIVLVLFGVGIMNYIFYIIDQKFNKEKKSLEDRLEPAIIKIEKLTTDFQQWMKDTSNNQNSQDINTFETIEKNAIGQNQDTNVSATQGEVAVEEDNNNKEK